MKLTILILLLSAMAFLAGTMFAQIAEVTPSEWGGVHPLTYTTNTMETIAVCEQTIFAKDRPWKVEKVAGCKLEGNHSLDEVIQVDMDNLSASNDRYDNLLKNINDYLEAERKILHPDQKVKK